MTDEQRWAKAVLNWTERVGGITVNGIRLASAGKDRSIFSQMLVLLREAEDMQPDEASKTAFRQSPQTIVDADGQSHTMTVTDVRALLVLYGSAYRDLWQDAQVVD